MGKGRLKHRYQPPEAHDDKVDLSKRKPSCNTPMNGCSIGENICPSNIPSDAIKVPCSNLSCPLIPYLHAKCYERWEGKLINALRRSITAWRGKWTKEHTFDSLWQPKGYMILMNMDLCKCTACGHPLRREILDERAQIAYEMKENIAAQRLEDEALPPVPRDDSSTKMQSTPKHNAVPPSSVKKKVTPMSKASSSRVQIDSEGDYDEDNEHIYRRPVSRKSAASPANAWNRTSTTKSGEFSSTDFPSMWADEFSVDNLIADQQDDGNMQNDWKTVRQRAVKNDSRTDLHAQPVGGHRGETRNLPPAPLTQWRATTSKIAKRPVLVEAKPPSSTKVTKPRLNSFVSSSSIAAFSSNWQQRLNDADDHLLAVAIRESKRDHMAMQVVPCTRAPHSALLATNRSTSNRPPVITGVLGMVILSDNVESAVVTTTTYIGSFDMRAYRSSCALQSASDDWLAKGDVVSINNAKNTPNGYVITDVYVLQIASMTLCPNASLSNAELTAITHEDDEESSLADSEALDLEDAFNDHPMDTVHGECLAYCSDYCPAMARESSSLPDNGFVSATIDSHRGLSDEQLSGDRVLPSAELIDELGDDEHRLQQCGGMTIRVTTATGSARTHSWQRSFDEHMRYMEAKSAGEDDAVMSPTEQLQCLDREQLTVRSTSPRYTVKRQSLEESTKTFAPYLPRRKTSALQISKPPNVKETLISSKFKMPWMKESSDKLKAAQRASSESPSVTTSTSVPDMWMDAEQTVSSKSPPPLMSLRVEGDRYERVADEATNRGGNNTSTESSLPPPMSQQLTRIAQSQQRTRMPISVVNYGGGPSQRASDENIMTNGNYIVHRQPLLFRQPAPQIRPLYLQQPPPYYGNMMTKQQVAQYTYNQMRVAHDHHSAARREPLHMANHGAPPPGMTYMYNGHQMHQQQQRPSSNGSAGHMW